MAEESKKAAAEAVPTREDDPEAADRALGKRMELAQNVFLLSVSDEVAGDAKDDLDARILSAIEENGMTPYYEALCLAHGWKRDDALVARMKAANDAELKKMDAKEEDVKENHGEEEQLDAAVDRAKFFDRIGDKEQALKLFDALPEKKQSLGQKIDVCLATVRVGLFHADLKLTKERIAKATELVESGGDWDRRNRLKVYEGAYSMMTRNFSRAAELFLESVATFNCYEMFSYNQFVFYTVVCSLLSLDRVRLKKEVVDSPEVLAAILEVPALSEFLNAFYECRYADFFGALVEVDPMLRRDRYLATHVARYVREMRAKAYTQFLESYRSVRLDTMASSFGVSSGFLDLELAKFIAAGRLNAKIDKVGGIIETNRPDARNAQYQAVIKEGDSLLNRIQKLARAVSA